MFQVLNVRLPQDGGRLKGFGYAEFADKATLLEALAMNEGVSERLDIHYILYIIGIVRKRDQP